MVLLQPKLHLTVSQRQILTPGLVQMVSVLALNKLELKDMITAEMVENPVLEELEDSVPLLDDVNRREEDRRLRPVVQARLRERLQPAGRVFAFCFERQMSRSSSIAAGLSQKRR